MIRKYRIIYIFFFLRIKFWVWYVPIHFFYFLCDWKRRFKSRFFFSFPIWESGTFCNSKFMMPKIVYWQFIYFEFAVIIEICKCIFFNIVSSYFFHFFCVNFVVHLNDGESQIDQSTSPSLFNSNLKTCCIKVAECSI